ncbi:MAG: hypothetical protein ABIR36_09125 [Nitrospiraceae bacterium]
MPFPNQNFFLYLNIDFLPAAWSAYRGQLITVSTFGTEEFRPLSYWPLGLLKDRRILRFQKELELERIRREFYSAQVSRLHGIYMWGDAQTARRGERWRETEGNHFHADYLVEVSFTYRRLSRVDTNWIDKYLLPDSVSFDRNDVAWMHSYWRGEPCPDSDPLWEYIAEGRGVIYGTTLRMQAYEKVKCMAPESLGQLELGRIAVELKSDLYHSAPFIRQIAQTQFRVDFFLDARDQNDDFMKKAGHYIDQLARTDSSKINWNALNLLRGDTRLPDLRSMGFAFDCQEFSTDERTLIESVVSPHDGSIWYGMTELTDVNLVPNIPHS